jgi:hypothetical protein
MRSPFRIEVRGNKHSSILICSELHTAIPKKFKLSYLDTRILSCDKRLRSGKALDLYCIRDGPGLNLGADTT